jgi:serine/threonine-protein kinase
VPLGCFRRPDLYPAPPDARLVAGLGAQACEGLHHAHNLKRPDGTSMEVVHRDVSANNLFATVDGVVKVLDFGIAKIQDASVRTSTGSVKGTYAYMAPEQLRGERVDRRTDVFAMGVVLWETFARRHLFKRDTEYLTFQAITTDPIPDVCELRPDVPPELGAAIAKALSRDRDARFPTARALGEAITRSAASLGGPTTPSEIADEIARAFASRLREQRALIQMAHEGRALDLEIDVGPGIGYGTELVTTPVSIITGQGARSVAPVIQPAEAARAIATSAPSAPRVVAPKTATLPVAPPKGHRWIAVVAGILGGAIAGAIVLWGLQSKPEPPATTAAAAVPATATVPVPASVPVPATATATATVPAAAAATATVPAAATDDKPKPKAAVTKPAPSPHTSTPVTPATPSGPDGFITIDSAPVYATISIDGHSYGETPLIHLSLPPGRHVIHAVSPSGATHNVAVSIEPGKVAPAARIEW